MYRTYVLSPGNYLLWCPAIVMRRIWTFIARRPSFRSWAEQIRVVPPTREADTKSHRPGCDPRGGCQAWLIRLAFAADLAARLVLTDRCWRSLAARAARGARGRTPGGAAPRPRFCGAPRHEPEACRATC